MRTRSLLLTAACLVWAAAPAMAATVHATYTGHLEIGISELEEVLECEQWDYCGDLEGQVFNNHHVADDVHQAPNGRILRWYVDDITRDTQTTVVSYKLCQYHSSSNTPIQCDELTSGGYARVSTFTEDLRIILKTGYDQDYRIRLISI